jgi:hypothetical protein
MFGPGGERFRKSVQRALAVAVKEGKAFSHYTSTSWTNFFRSPLLGAQSALVRKDKRSIAVSPLQVAEIAVVPKNHLTASAAALVLPAVPLVPLISLAMTSTASAMPLLSAVPLVQLTVPCAGVLYLLGGPIRAQAYEIGSVVCVRADTTPGARPNQSIGIPLAQVEAFDRDTGLYTVRPKDGSFSRTRNVTEHQLAPACMDSLDVLYSARNNRLSRSRCRSVRCERGCVRDCVGRAACGLAAGLPLPACP